MRGALPSPSYRNCPANQTVSQKLLLILPSDDFIVPTSQGPGSPRQDADLQPDLCQYPGLFSELSLTVPGWAAHSSTAGKRFWAKFHEENSLCLASEGRLQHNRGSLVFGLSAWKNSSAYERQRNVTSHCLVVSKQVCTTSVTWASRDHTSDPVCCACLSGLPTVDCGFPPDLPASSPWMDDSRPLVRWIYECI